MRALCQPPLIKDDPSSTIVIGFNIPTNIDIWATSNGATITISSRK